MARHHTVNSFGESVHRGSVSGTNGRQIISGEGGNGTRGRNLYFLTGLTPGTELNPGPELTPGTTLTPATMLTPSATMTPGVGWRLVVSADL